MNNRSHAEEIVFRRPFRLKGNARPEPAGTYLLTTEEELVEGLSFAAWRRIATTLTRQVAPGVTVQAIPVSPRDLAEAQAADALD